MQYIKALVQIVSLLKALISIYQEWRKELNEQQERESASAIDKLKKAKTEKEIRDAIKDVAKNP